MKRRDRIIPDYYEHIRKGKQEKTFEEIVVQFGDINDCSVGSENGELNDSSYFLKSLMFLGTFG